MINQLLSWLDASTCNVMAVQTIKQELISAGYSELEPTHSWCGKLERGGKYFTVKNGTAIFAFHLGSRPEAETGYRIISSHSDSPTFKIKPNAEIYGEGGVVTLNVEKYGGGILYTWFDRPLSISGRVALRTDNPLEPRMVAVDLRRPVATIPHLAIHFNRAVNEGNPLSVQKDMKPVMGVFSREEIDAYKANGGVVRTLLADELKVNPSDILEYELNLYPVEKASLVGANESLFQSGRIDDLSMAFASLRALLDSDLRCPNPEATRVMAVFDNEETGSGTKQGAASPVLADTLRRMATDLGASADDFGRAVSRTFMISADDAHAWHPNYNEKYDPTNHALIGRGPAVKINANCKYMTDADGAAVFKSLCEKAEVPMQYFVNHSDVLGGSTLGNILTGQMDIRGVDMGNPIWAMHSARETASVADHVAAVRVFTEFFKL